jgi:O-succinylhomoserine sulfhydrylase
VERVFYAGLDTHPGHALAARQQSAFGGVLSFRVRGGRDAKPGGSSMRPG